MFEPRQSRRADAICRRCCLSDPRRNANCRGNARNWKRLKRSNGAECHLRGKRSWRQAAGTSPAPRARTPATVEINELATMANEPVIVQRHHDWNTAMGRLMRDPGRKARQVMHVNDVWAPLIEKIGGDALNR